MKYIYLSPVTSYMFRCLLHHLQGDHCLTCSKLYAFCNVAVKCTIYPVFFKFTMLLQCLNNTHFALLCFKNLKILNCRTLISVGSCYLLCMLAIYVVPVSSCVWVHNGVEMLRRPHSTIKYKTIIFTQ